MDTLPVELLHVIASYDQACYRALLAIPSFGRSLTPGTIVDYKISFGYGVEIAYNRNYGSHIAWTLNGKIHREDGPAVEYAGGRREWWINGNHHREDGPAIEYANGDKRWYQNGRPHREDGPAIEYTNGSKYWYKNGIPHREDGPAAEYENGTKEWYVNGILVKRIWKHEKIK